MLLAVVFTLELLCVERCKLPWFVLAPFLCQEFADFVVEEGSEVMFHLSSDVWRNSLW